MMDPSLNWDCPSGLPSSDSAVFHASSAQHQEPQFQFKRPDAAFTPNSVPKFTSDASLWTRSKVAAGRLCKVFSSTIQNVGEAATLEPPL